MKKGLWIFALALIFSSVACFAASPPFGGGMGKPPMHGGVYMGRPPMGGHPPMGGGMMRPPMGRPPMHMAGRPVPPPPPMIRPIPMYRPYYYSSYYPRVYYTSYSYSPYDETVAPATTVVVRDDYAGVNTAANVINAATNVAATIRYLSW